VRTAAAAVAFAIAVVAPAAQVAVPTRAQLLAIEDARAPRSADVQALLTAARDGKDGDQALAVRALGRLERRDVIPQLLGFVPAFLTRGDAADAIAQSFLGKPLDGVAQGVYEQAALEALLAAGAMELSRPNPGALSAIARSLGRLPYVNPDQVRGAEAFLRRALERRLPPAFCPFAYAARGLESLARFSRKVATLEVETIEQLRAVVQTITPSCAESRRNAMAALIASQGIDRETLKAALTDDDVETRRLAVLALSGSGSIIQDEERLSWIRALFSDSSLMIRYEAVRAWARRGAPTHGCTPLLEALSDSSMHVVLAALDALGDLCKDEQTITERLASEARTPPPQGRWQREMHAFVALAKRDRERANIGMLSFAMHTVWQVRMYAARAAAVAEDVGVLERLAADPENNVAEAALTPLRLKIGAASDAAFIAVLKRPTRTILKNVPVRPYQVIRTAAKALEGARPTTPLVEALVGALTRISAEDCETSRDVRLALIERLGELGSVANARALMPLFKDIDPVVAQAAAALVSTWTGRLVEPDLVARLPVATEEEATPKGSPRGGGVVFEMDNGRRFEASFSTETPLTRARVASLVERRYYDNLTFHRVVPNFVIQGGSPGANEYCGACPFMRDELGVMHERGTIGVSTRGRDTGDAQIFINLVDNYRLDYQYTAFARLCSPRDLDVVNDIQEGDRISRVLMPATPACGR
jgi:cyclophilin family peptidyl-prolyl cis-trans isomerase/HEAT repeat protein